MEDPKRDYLIKTLSRTKRKDYENYIINAIWHKLDRSDIQPVTQQYIKRSDGRYALVDLFFPQINIGIECDEEYHIDNEEKDLNREITMEQMLSAYDETDGFELHRIKAYERIEDIEKQIDDVVSNIKNKIRRSTFPAWDFNEKPYDIAITKKIIHVADRLAFRTIVDICKCFGKDYDGMQRAFFEIGHGYYLWCPKLAVYHEGKHRSVSQGWINILSDDWNSIYETNDDVSKINSAGEKLLNSHPRIVFAKSTDILGRSAYRFIGVFKVDQEDPKTSNISVVHKRISQYIDLAPWLVAVSTEDCQ
jgi:very-short-patch-repair endonuclease